MSEAPLRRIIEALVTAPSCLVSLSSKGGKLYWCDREGMRVMRCNLDGSLLETLIGAGRLIWGNQASVLVGDYLLGQAFLMMVETGSLEALRVLASAAAIIAEGEVLQLAASHDMTATEDAYMRVIGAKTAALFSAAAKVGAIIANRRTDEQEALESYGRNFGIAFQLVDDALDYSGNQSLMGKCVGDDFREGKITLPVVLSYGRGTSEERNFWRRTFEDGNQTTDDLPQALRLMERHHAIGDTVELARHYGDLASDALAIFHDSTHKQALLEAVNFCVGRVN